jgi:hypothetical protein
MKIALIGPGIMPIPPPGWGAVEILIWDYYKELTAQGHMVEIINTKKMLEIISIVNAGKFDFVHLHYDVFFHILDKLECPNIAITSHYPYIDKLDKHMYDGYSNIFYFLLKSSRYYNFVLADKDYATFLKYGANPAKLKKIKNGINSEAFVFTESAKYSKCIYLGKVTPRKNQSKYQYLPNIDFVGNVDDPNFNKRMPNYLGEWTREKIHNELTNYANLLLISEGEADPLVVKEALIAGLGVVINKSSSENLDVSHDFITVLDDSKLNDLQYIYEIIQENMAICTTKRQLIRKYGIETFDIKIEVGKYLDLVHQLIQ